MAKYINADKIMREFKGFKDRLRIGERAIDVIDRCIDTICDAKSEDVVRVTRLKHERVPEIMTHNVVTPAPGLECICGCKNVFRTVVIVEGCDVHQLHCANCGIIMRAPIESGAEWIQEHWRKVHMQDAVKVVRCKNCKLWNRDEYINVDGSLADYGTCNMDGLGTLESDYCSYGKNREAK